METYALNYVTRDGRVYSGDTPFQVVDAMRADSMMTEHKDVELYMKGAAERFARIERVAVRSDTPEHFVADLVKSRIIKHVRAACESQDQGE